MNSFMSNSNLILASDVVRFALTYVVLFVIPGYALATLARPRSLRIERVALSIPCAYSLVALSGLASIFLHLPFVLAIYAIFALPVTVVWAYAWWRQRREHVVDVAKRWWLAPAAVAVVQVAIIAIVYAHYVFPVGVDVVVHVIWTNAIVNAHIYPITLMSSHIGSDDASFYPPTFHALVALLLSVAPMTTYRAVFLSVVSVVVFFPFALFTYVRVVTGSNRLSTWAVLASLSFEALPLFALAQGLYPVTVALLFMPTLAIVLRYALGDHSYRSVALAAILGVGLLYTHPTEFVAAALPMLAIGPAIVRSVRSWLHTGIACLILVGVWLVAALPARSAMHQAIAYAVQDPSVTAQGIAQQAHIDLTQIIIGYLQWVYGRNVSYVLFFMVLIGITQCFIKRRFLGLVGPLAIGFIVFVDVNSYDLLRHIHLLSFHWTWPDRLIPAHYWLVLPVAAVGIDVVLKGLNRLRSVRSLSTIALIASPVLLLGVILPLSVTIGRLTTYSAARNETAPADIGSLTWLVRHSSLPSSVLNDGDITHSTILDGATDAGLWLSALGGPQPVFFRSQDGIGPLDDRLFLLQHIGDNPLPNRAQQFIDRYHVQYVFYGAYIAPLARRHLHLARLLHDQRLHLIYSSTPTCSVGENVSSSICPASGSYVFAL